MDQATAAYICSGCGGRPDHAPESKACAIERERQIREAVALKEQERDEFERDEFARLLDKHRETMID